MRDRNGNRRDVWVMVDHDGQRTLFQLVEVGKGADVSRLARELHAPAVVVDMALPALPPLDEPPGGHRQSASSRLILLNVRTAAGGGANGVVFRTGAQGAALESAGMRHRDVPRAGIVGDRA
jgi:hypothetical protein